MYTVSPPPLRRIGAELLFRSTMCAWSRAAWDVRIAGADRLPDGPCFIYGNHSNNYDPFILNLFTELGRSTAGVMTMEHVERGLVGWLFRSTGIEGTRKHEPEPHLIRRIFRMLEDGRRVVIFPEGGRRWDGRPAPWIRSTAKIFQRAGVPVHPVLIHGSYVSWPRWARWPRPAHVVVEPLPAVDLSNCRTTDEAIQRLALPISADENRVDMSMRPAWAWRPADGIERLIYRDPDTGDFNTLTTRDGWNVVDHSGAHRFTVRADSHMVRSDGQASSSADVYARIRDLAFHPDPDGCILSHPARIRTEHDTDVGKSWSPWRTGSVSLHVDHVQLDGRILPLEQIRHMALERSDRIWLSGAGPRVYCHFPEPFSVLAWYDALLRLAPHINA